MASRFANGQPHYTVPRSPGLTIPSRPRARFSVLRRAVLSDLDIAQQVTLTRIAELITDRLGIDGTQIEPHGHYKAKLPLDFVDSLAGRPDGKLVLVTALSPTPAGEGK